MAKFKILILVSCISMLLSGCMYSNINSTIKQDGSGVATIRVGITKEGYDAILSMGEDIPTSKGEIKTFDIDGITYYGDEKIVEFSKVYELNSILNSPNYNSKFDFDIETGTFSIRQFSDGSIRFEMLATKNTGDTSSIERMIKNSDNGKSDDQIEEILNTFRIELSVDFPSNVKQTLGSSTGVEIYEDKLTLDLIAIGNDISNLKDINTVKYEFETDAYLTGDAKLNTDIFKDVTVDDWYYEAVTEAAYSGDVSGTGNEMFYPDNALTVAQLCKIIDNSLSLTDKSEIYIESDYWAYEAILNCLRAEIIETKGDIVSQNYDIPITRQEAVSVIMNVIDTSGIDVVNKAPAIPDIDDISNKYKNNIVLAYKYGIVSGVDNLNTFNPNGILTRAEICQLLYRVGVIG